MYLADTLSRAYLPVNVCDRRPSVENIDATVFLPVTAERLQQIRHADAEYSGIYKGGRPRETTRRLNTLNIPTISRPSSPRIGHEIQCDHRKAVFDLKLLLNNLDKLIDFNITDPQE